MAREIVRFMLVGLLLLLLASIFSVEAAAPFFSPATLQQSVQLGAWTAGISLPFQWGVPLIISVGVIVPLISIGTGIVLLGFSLVTLPWLGPGILNLFIVSAMIGLELRRLIFGLDFGIRVRLRDVEQGIIVVSILALLLFLLGAALTFLIEFDPLLLSSIFKAGGMAAACEFIIGQNQPWWRGLTALAGWVTAVLLLYQLFAVKCLYADSAPPGSLKGGRTAPVFNKIFSGLVAGVLFSSIIGALQIAGFWPSNTVQQTWGGINSTLTDPASFGAVSAIVVPLLLILVRGPGRFAAVLAAALFLFISLWSGSRTLGLGLAVFWLWYISGLMVIDRSRPRLRYFALVLVLASVTVGLGYPPLNEAMRRIPGDPPSVTKVLELLNWETGADVFNDRNFQSRRVFQVWRTHPLVGVGLGRMSDARLTGTAADLSDNQGLRRSNNFYLLVLAETGIIGLLILVIALVLISRMLRGEPAIPQIASDADEAEEQQIWRFPPMAECLFHTRGALLTVLIMLLTGPHLLYDEFRYLTVVLLALATSSASSIEARGLFQARWLLFGMTLVFPVIYASAIIASTRLHVEKGLYRSEAESGRIFAWSGLEARVGVCRIDGPVVLHLRTADPLVAEKPITVRIELARAGEDAILGELLISDTQWHDVILDQSELGDQPLPAVLTISVNRMWQQWPSGRWLGLAVEWTSGLCPWAR